MLGNAIELVCTSLVIVGFVKWRKKRTWKFSVNFTSSSRQYLPNFQFFVKNTKERSNSFIGSLIFFFFFITLHIECLRWCLMLESIEKYRWFSFELRKEFGIASDWFRLLTPTAQPIRWEKLKPVGTWPFAFFYPLHPPCFTPFERLACYIFELSMVLCAIFSYILVGRYGHSRYG